MLEPKYANIEQILEIKSSPQRITSEGFAKFAALDDAITEGDGYLYVRCRAISSRVNKNNDGWPAAELAAAYNTFRGRPIYVDHHNDDPKRTRGVIVESKLHVEDEKHSALDPYYSKAPENHKPPTWIELLLEVDGETFPKLAEAIRKGDIDAVSMGANIDKSICSVCANEASTPSEYCKHIKTKGLEFEITADNGETIRKKAYEDCYGVNFFEISFVFDPADETALIHEKKGAVKEALDWQSIYVAAASTGLIAVYGWDFIKSIVTGAIREDWHNDLRAYLKEYVHEMKPEDQEKIVRIIQDAQGKDKVSYSPTMSDLEQFIEPAGTSHDDRDRNYNPQSDQVTAPQQVDTLRDEMQCPVCHADTMKTDPDGIVRCETCGHVQEPEPLDNPDLSKAKENDELNKPDLNSDPLDEEQVEIRPLGPETKPNTTNPTISRKRISDMNVLTTILTTSSKEAADEMLPPDGAAEGAPVAGEGSGVDTTIGVARGVDFRTHSAFKQAGITARITYPAANVPDNTTEVPGNPIKDFKLAMISMKNLGIQDIKQVPIQVQSDRPDEAVNIIHDESVMPPGMGPGAGGPPPGPPVQAATGKPPAKRPILPDQKVQVIPTGQVISDQLTPKETAVKPEEKPEENAEQKLLAAFALADELVDTNILDKNEKHIYIAHLEEKSLVEIEAQKELLERIKAAGLKKVPARLAGSGVSRVPRLAHNAVANNNGNGSIDNIPDEAIFFGGI